MANAFGFKTKTDYSDVTAARQRQTAQTALQLKDAMKNVSSTIIEKRIAKKYDDPYSIEAMKERQVSYAGIDPTRSEQARKYINDAMTQQRLDIEQGYKQRAEKRAERSLQGTETNRIVTRFNSVLDSVDGDLEQAKKIAPSLWENVQKIYNVNSNTITGTESTGDVASNLAGRVGKTKIDDDTEDQTTDTEIKDNFFGILQRTPKEIEKKTDEEVLNELDNLYAQRNPLFKNENLPFTLGRLSQRGSLEVKNLENKRRELEKELRRRRKHRNIKTIKNKYKESF